MCMCYIYINSHINKCNESMYASMPTLSLTLRTTAGTRDCRCVILSR